MAAADLEALAADYPGWQFLATYVESDSGRGRRTILAKRRKDGLLVGGLTAHEVIDQIVREERLS